MENLKLDGKQYALWLQGEPNYRKESSRGDCYSYSERKAKHWKGTGKLTVKADGKEYFFLFVTDSWREGEKNWDRSLFFSVISFTNANGFDVFPIIIDQYVMSDSIAHKIYVKLHNDDNKNAPNPSIHIRTEKVEPLIERGALSEPGGQIRLDLTVVQAG